MSIRGPFLLILLILTAGAAHAQTSLRMRTQPPVQIKEESEWSGAIRYALATDYADTFTPRGYTNSLMGNLSYKISDSWSVSLEAGGRAEFFDGQVEKGTEQSYDETFSPTTSLDLSYESEFNADADKYSIGVHGEPLWDEASRLEGYKGLFGAGGNVLFAFFGKRYSFNNIVDVTELANTFRYSAEGSPNPDYFITYKMAHAIKLFSTWKVGYTFGFKTTRYLDGFWGYNYENAFVLSKSFGKASVALSYDQGGFTDDGTVKFWFIDEYRRIASLRMTYTF